MRLILTGYPYSKLILPSSSWLWKKYSPESFNIEWLNFGSYDGQLFKGKYVELAEKQEGGKGAWSKYVLDYVKSIDDRKVILGCDDFLINSKIDIKRYKELLKLMGDDVKCARLADITWYPPNQYNCDARGIVSLKPTADYLSTGQLTIWDRKALIKVLKASGDIWSFESRGSQIMQEHHWRVVASFEPPFKYHTLSALSGGDGKIDLAGLTEEDREYIIKNLIKEGNVK